ncbi:BgTH12-00927 [Blumeria graminis f. sp. triticale]|uniref:Large ribosomal subunit protein mL46 n=3 Tax=Blumeria graminis TaxID=34373 RepID=A0A381L8C6_BLUGR|nr:Mitochondrial ribosomal protein [Blumeria graminis f. sp. tritici 96224]CAD6505436.1 BgTH12-00927 [Blumeria graminis f. sp. triticale]VDB93568.1 Bgt-2343 [Blumeria graminis f. sp. tritici]
MSANYRRYRSLASVIRISTPNNLPTVCLKCGSRTSANLFVRPLARRAHSSTRLIEIQEIAASDCPNAIPVPRISINTHQIFAGVVLSRPPLVTPDLHSFEKAFFFYQKRLNERLAIPFTRYFYFKKDSPADTDWKLKASERGGVPAKELGSYKAYGKLAWNDELLEKERHMAEPQYIIDQLTRDARVGVTEDGVVVQDVNARAEGVAKLNSRITDADTTNNDQRLDRKLDRTLYLVVRNKDDNTWGFPSGGVSGTENLHEAAERILAQSCGINMNTWIVGRVPIAYNITSPKTVPAEIPAIEAGPRPEHGVPHRSKATFFLKGRIMAGQADLLNNHFGLDNYRWLTKEEVSKLLPRDLYLSVCNSMHER